MLNHLGVRSVTFYYRRYGGAMHGVGRGTVAGTSVPAAGTAGRARTRGRTRPGSDAGSPPW